MLERLANSFRSITIRKPESKALGGFGLALGRSGVIKPAKIIISTVSKYSWIVERLFRRLLETRGFQEQGINTLYGLDRGGGRVNKTLHHNRWRKLRQEQRSSPPMGPHSSGVRWGRADGNGVEELSLRIGYLTTSRLYGLYLFSRRPTRRVACSVIGDQRSAQAIQVLNKEIHGKWEGRPRTRRRFFARLRMTRAGHRCNKQQCHRHPHNLGTA